METWKSAGHNCRYLSRAFQRNSGITAQRVARQQKPNDPPSDGALSPYTARKALAPNPLPGLTLAHLTVGFARHQEHSTHTETLVSPVSSASSKPEMLVPVSLKAYTRDRGRHAGSHRGRDIHGPSRAPGTLGRGDWGQTRATGTGSGIRRGRKARDRMTGHKVKNPSRSWPLSWGRMGSPRAPALSLPQGPPTQVNGQRTGRAAPLRQ